MLISLAAFFVTLTAAVRRGLSQTFLRDIVRPPSSGLPSELLLKSRVFQKMNICWIGFQLEKQLSHIKTGNRLHLHNLTGHMEDKQQAKGNAITTPDWPLSIKMQLHGRPKHSPDSAPPGGSLGLQEGRFSRDGGKD